VVYFKRKEHDANDDSAWLICSTNRRKAIEFNFSTYNYKVLDKIYTVYNRHWEAAFNKARMWEKLKQ